MLSFPAQHKGGKRGVKVELLLIMEVDEPVNHSSTHFPIITQNISVSMHLYPMTYKTALPHLWQITSKTK